MAKKRLRGVVLVEVRHKCGHVVGLFGAGEGSVSVRCEGCGGLVSIHVGCIGMLVDSFECPEDEPVMIESPHRQDGCVFTVLRVKVR